MESNQQADCREGSQEKQTSGGASGGEEVSHLPARAVAPEPERILECAQTKRGRVHVAARRPGIPKVRAPLSEPLRTLSAGDKQPGGPENCKMQDPHACSTSQDDANRASSG